MSLQLQPPFFILINGSIGHGKSHLIKYIMSKHRKQFDYGIVFTQTWFKEGNFDYVPEEYVHKDYDENILKNFMNIQSKLIKKGISKQTFCILDDVLDTQTFNNKYFKRLITTLRHFQISVIISTQYCNSIPPIFRNNVMGTAIFKSDMNTQLRALFESYGMNFNNFNEFKNYVMTNTGNYNFIWYDKKTNGDIKDKYKVMRCPKKIPEFMLEFNLQTNLN